jgi:2-dehydropantoate 2-reductase
MRFVIYGAGAIGGALGGRLHQHGHDVVLIARGAHYEAMRAHGLRLIDPETEIVLPMEVVDDPSRVAFDAGDTVVLAMKTQDTEPALAALASHAPPGVAIVCAQNGVENERRALRRFAHVYAMCVMCPAAHLEPGVVEASSTPITGLMDLGCYPSGIDGRGVAIAEAIAASTFESIPRPDIMRWKYTKLLMNLGNAVEALCGHVEGAGEISRRARSEGAAVLRAAGIDAASREEDRERRGDRLQPRPIGGATRPGGSSWQSLRRGSGSIESDYLNGEIVLLGHLHDVPTPVNATLARLANAAARDGRSPGTMSPDDVLRAITAAN